MGMTIFYMLIKQDILVSLVIYYYIVNRGKKISKGRFMTE